MTHRAAPPADAHGATGLDAGDGPAGFAEAAAGGGCTVLQFGFDAHLAVRLWAQWRGAAAPGARLHHVALVRPEQLTRGAMRAWHEAAHGALGGAADALAPALETLARVGLDPVEGLHPVALDGGRVHLLLAAGDAATTLGALHAQADAVLIDSRAAPQAADLHALLRRLASRMRPGATLTVVEGPGPAGAVGDAGAAEALRGALVAAGFEPAGGLATGQADAGRERPPPAAFRPRVTSRRAGHEAVRRLAPGATVAIVGGGIAGATMAWAAAQQGWRPVVLDAGDAREGAAGLSRASDTPAAVFHASPHGDPAGPDRRLLAAAAAVAARTYAPFVERGLPGSVAGLLQWLGDTAPAVGGFAPDGEAPRVGMPGGEVLDAEAAAAAASGPRLAPGAWVRWRDAGWVAGPPLIAALIEAAGATAHRGTRVQALVERAGRWALLDAAGHELLRADAVVLAQGAEALRLASTVGAALPPGAQPARVRGQLSIAPRAAVAAAPSLPLAGFGHAVALPDGRLAFGATRAVADEHPTARDADEAFNAARLQRLVPGALRPEAAAAHGEGCDTTTITTATFVGWRVQARDRRPVAGLWPAGPAAAAWPGRSERVPVPRVPGLAVLTALGSRGFTLAPLLAKVVAAQLAAAPVPLEDRLLRAIDPLRLFRPARR
jgi:tRNA 5-methylaminomethyl-2-thiouridine biosynthesis bifunctional protein